MDRYRAKVPDEILAAQAKYRAERLIERAIANAQREEDARSNPSKQKAESDIRQDSGKAKPVAKVASYIRSSGSAGGGGMNPTDIEKVPGKRQLKLKSGGKVSASKRADGCAVRGKTKGKMV